MAPNEVTPAELEAWRELHEAERALELAQLRLWTIMDQARRREHGHLRVIDGEAACDARR